MGRTLVGVLNSDSPSPQLRLEGECSRSCPVISAGMGTPKAERIVGAKSVRLGSFFWMARLLSITPGTIRESTQWSPLQASVLSNSCCRGNAPKTVSHESAVILVISNNEVRGILKIRTAVNLICPKDIRDDLTAVIGVTNIRQASDQFALEFFCITSWLNGSVDFAAGEIEIKSVDPQSVRSCVRPIDVEQVAVCSALAGVLRADIAVVQQPRIQIELPAKRREAVVRHDHQQGFVVGSLQAAQWRDRSSHKVRE